MKNMQYNSYLWPNCQNFCGLEEIGVEEHDSDVQFLTECRNMAISRVHAYREMHLHLCSG